MQPLQKNSEAAVLVCPVHIKENAHETVPLTAGTTYTVTQTANANPTDFVSQRAHGVMWEFVVVPEPATTVLVGLAMLGTLGVVRRRNG